MCGSSRPITRTTARRLNEASLVFLTPLLLVRTFRFGGIYLFGAFGAASLAAGVRIGEGFIDCGVGHLRRRLVKPTVL